MNDLNPRNCKTTMGGPRQSVFLAMSTVGIGDDISAMPAVSQLVRDGYDVTVNCKPFHAPIWKALGVTVTTLQEPLGMDWMERNWDVYGTFYSLYQWSIWEANEEGEEITDHMVYFANIFGVSLPLKYSWLEILRPVPSAKKPYIVFAPESAEVWRTIPEMEARAIYESLKKDHEVIWLSQGSRAVLMDTWKRMKALVPEMLRHTIGAEMEEDIREREEQEQWRIRDCTIFDSFEELVDCVFNAEQIIAVEGGVAAIASAFKKPLTVIHGATDHEHTIGQFKRYHSDWNYTAVTGKPNGCSMPCYRRPERGFKDMMCGGGLNVPFCLSTLPEIFTLQLQPAQ